MVYIFNMVVIVIHISKVPLTKEYFKEMKMNFIDIIEELKMTRSSLKMKLILRVVFEFDNDHKKVRTEIFIHNQKIMLENNFNMFVDDLIKSFMKEHSNIDKKTEIQI